MPPAATGPRRVLAITGSTRSASSNTALCRTAVACAPPGVEVTVFEDLATLPHFDPDDDHEPLPAAVADLRAAIEGCDAVLICTRSTPARCRSMKNLLDQAVGATVMNGKPVVWVNVSPDARRGAGALGELAIVLGYVQATVVEGACAHVAIVREGINADGVVTDASTRAAITATLTALLAAGRSDLT